MQEHHLTVPRTARFYTLGNIGPELREIWFVLHGYGQLAGYFLKRFAPLNDGHRLIVAPEALSRFYLEGTGGRVGATWMTREDRLREIQDYVNYLDTVKVEILRQLDRPEVPITVLGFSQGTATACRWVTQGHVRPTRLILWAGGIPPDVSFDGKPNFFEECRLILVLGDNDPYLTPELVEEHQNRLQQVQIPFRLIRYPGGHRIDGKVLKSLAATSPTDTP
ncbi:MAG: phospholipase [Calditrichaeota bacterium]|nr:MAG: phospholipase [Calditrichota bacterium]